MDILPTPPTHMDYYTPQHTRTERPRRERPGRTAAPAISPALLRTLGRVIVGIVLGVLAWWGISSLLGGSTTPEPTTGQPLGMAVILQSGSGSVRSATDEVLSELQAGDTADVGPGERLVLGGEAIATARLQAGTAAAGQLALGGPLALTLRTGVLELSSGRVLLQANDAAAGTRLETKHMRASLGLGGGSMVLVAGEGADMLGQETGISTVQVKRPASSNIVAELQLAFGQQADISAGAVPVPTAFDTTYLQNTWRVAALAALQTAANTPAAPAVETPTTPATNNPTTTPTAPTGAVGTAPAATSTLSAPVITTPRQGDVIPGTQQVIIEGTAPQGAQAMLVNGYRLQLFRAGQERWTYIASKQLGTLKDGSNTIEAWALDDKGLATEKATVTFSFGAAATTPTATAPATSGSSTPAAGTLAAPTLTRPALGADGTIATSANIALEGRVPAGTAAVEVNGYRLNLFKAGSTSWRYLAETGLGTMKAGRNVYRIVAFDKNNLPGAALEVVVVYTAPTAAAAPTATATATSSGALSFTGLQRITEDKMVPTAADKPAAPTNTTPEAR